MKGLPLEVEGVWGEYVKDRVFDGVLVPGVLTTGGVEAVEF